MINHIQAIILGIIEGITEFLPISSTAHLVLAGNLMKIPATDFYKSFEIFIQLGAILSVVVLYWKKFWNWEIFKRLVVAFIPTAIIGLVAYKFFKEYLLSNTSVILWSLVIGGLLLIILEQLHFKKRENFIDTDESNITEISYGQSAALGIFQAIAIIPGVSRSGATIIGGLLMGIKRKTIVEFSFMLAVPTMLAATGLDLLKSAHDFTAHEFSLLGVGFVVTFFTALLAIKFLLAYIKKHSFTTFGVYRIVIAIIFFLVK